MNGKQRQLRHADYLEHMIEAISFKLKISLVSVAI